MTPIFLIEANGRYFEFKAAGLTPEEAVKGIVDAWTIHCEQAPADEEALFDGGIEVYRNIMVAGDGYRDHKNITGNDPKDIEKLNKKLNKAMEDAGFDLSRI